MICENCGKDSLRVTTYYTNRGNRIVNCKECPDRYTPPPIQMRGVKYIGGVKGSRRTVAMDNHISRLSVSPDGESCLDYKRKSFTLR